MGSVHIIGSIMFRKLFRSETISLSSFKSFGCGLCQCSFLGMMVPYYSSYGSFSILTMTRTSATNCARLYNLCFKSLAESEILGWPFSFMATTVDRACMGLVCAPEPIRRLGLFTVGIFQSFFIPFFSHSHDSCYFFLLFSFILINCGNEKVRMEKKSKEK